MNLLLNANLFLVFITLRDARATHTLGLALELVSLVRLGLRRVEHHGAGADAHADGCLGSTLAHRCSISRYLQNHVPIRGEQVALSQLLLCQLLPARLGGDSLAAGCHAQGRATLG